MQVLGTESTTIHSLNVCLPSPVSPRGTLECGGGGTLECGGQDCTTPARFGEPLLSWVLASPREQETACTVYKFGYGSFLKISF